MILARPEVLCALRPDATIAMTSEATVIVSETTQKPPDASLQRRDRHDLNDVSPSVARSRVRNADPQIAARVRDCRLQRGISQAGLARTAGIGQGSLSNYELGKRGLSLEAAVRLAKALGMTLAELVSIEEQRRFVGDGTDALSTHACIAIAAQPGTSDQAAEADRGDDDGGASEFDLPEDPFQPPEPVPPSTVVHFQVSKRQVEIAVRGGPLTKSEITLIIDYMAIQGRIASFEDEPPEPTTSAGAAVCHVPDVE